MKYIYGSDRDSEQNICFILSLIISLVTMTILFFKVWDKEYHSAFVRGVSTEEYSTIYKKKGIVRGIDIYGDTCQFTYDADKQEEYNNIDSKFTNDLHIWSKFSLIVILSIHMIFCVLISYLIPYPLIGYFWLYYRNRYFQRKLTTKERI